MELAALRRTTVLSVIRVGRRAVANTPLQRLPLVTAVYRRVFAAGFGADEETVAGFRGVRLRVPTRDTTIVPGILGGWYEDLVLEAFEQLCGASRTVVDVGGNLGVFACVGGRALPAGGRLVTFEPVPANLDLLRANVALNGLAEVVEVRGTAVGDAAGEVVLHLHPHNVGTHSVSAANAQSTGASVTVPRVDLDTACAGLRPVDVLKVDVEGYDGHVLRGAARLLREDAPALVVEYVPAHLRGCGFPPGEFLDLVFDGARVVHLVDDVRRRVRPVDRAEVEGGGDGATLNLLALRRSEHVDLLAGWAERWRA